MSGSTISGSFRIKMSCGHNQDHWYSGDRNKKYDNFEKRKKSECCDKCKENNRSNLHPVFKEITDIFFSA